MNCQIQLEIVSATAISGWAYLPELPNVHLEIRLTQGGSTIGQCYASNYRDDLASAGIGFGDHAFDLRIESALQDGQLEPVQCLAVTPDGIEVACVVVPFVSNVDQIEEQGITPKFPPKPRRLQLFSMPTSDGTQRPVFVLGAARSGTSAMAQALLRSAEFEGFNEGHFLWMLSRFLGTIHDFYAENGEDSQRDRFTMLSHVPYTYMTSGVRAVFIAAINEMFAGKRWLDKTPRPEMINAAVLMKELWPNAQFVFMKRRAIENVLSRVKKFPTLSFATLCADWAKSMEAWLVVRDLLGSSCIEVEQLSLARAPDQVSHGVARFLAISDDAFARFRNALSEEFPERSSDLDAPTRSIEETGWSANETGLFRAICGPMMAAYGYGYGREYYRTPVRSVVSV